MRFPGVGYINGRMSMGARLGMLSILFVVPTVILLTMFIAKSWTEIKTAKTEQVGSQYLAEIWPAYREAAGVLRGNAGTALDNARGAYDAKLGTASQAQAFLAATGSDKMNAGVELISAVADASGLALDPGAATYSLIVVTTDSFPTMLDGLAEARTAASLPVSPERGARMAEALQRIRTEVDEVQGKYATALKAEPDALASLSASASTIKAASNKLEGHLPAVLAGAPASEVEADIDALRSAIDQNWLATQSAMDSLIDSRVDGQFKGLMAQLGMVGVFMALSAILATVIAKGLSGRINTLLGVMDKLVGGDVAVDVPHLDDSNETGRIAATVGAFKQSLIDSGRMRAERGELDARAEEQRLAEQAREAAAAKEQAVVVTMIAEGLTKLSGGILTYRINEAFAPSYEKLRADFNAAMEQLQGAMKVVAANAQGIRSGAGEISQASDDLSRRTEQQAASLEETAAALDEITATVRKTAEGSTQARETVSVAKSDAETSGRIVQEAISAMGEIEDSSRQISQIIGVIDEIAFQTNLLALNAGVEAARAGDAGRGFAVVASEVRALAQRSADAAKEIKTLISASTQQVGRGVNLVGETGKALERIVTQIAEINGVVAEIAASAQEQAVGLAQVNTAVNQMDQVTQQNAAMVEQSTAASHALAHEAEDLGRLIARFELGETERTAVAPRAAAAPVRTHTPVTAMRTMSRAGGSAAVRKPDVQDEQGWDEF